MTDRRFAVSTAAEGGAWRTVRQFRHGEYRYEGRLRRHFADYERIRLSDGSTLEFVLRAAASRF